MKNVIIFAFIAMFAIMFLGCSVEMADYETADTKTPGTEGGYCLNGDVCAKGLECVKGICVKEEPVTDKEPVKDDESVVDDEEKPDTDTTPADEPKCLTEENDCQGLKMVFDKPLTEEANIATFGTEDEGWISTFWPTGKSVVEFKQCTCSAIAYADRNETPLKPVKCIGYRPKGDGTYHEVECEPFLNGRHWVCSHTCD